MATLEQIILNAAPVWEETVWEPLQNKDFQKAGLALQKILAVKEAPDWADIDWDSLITGPESFRGNLAQFEWDNFKPWIYEAVFEAATADSLAFLFQNIPTEMRSVIQKGILNAISQKAEVAGMETEKWLESSKPSIYRYLKTNLAQDLGVNL